MKTTEYAEFSESVFVKAAELPMEQRVPLNGMVELTRLCSLKCTHCYIGDSRWVKDPGELTTGQLKALMDTLAERGTLWLCFTGGEAMIRPDFRELWLYAKSKGFILTLFTNATLISSEMAVFLHENPPFNIEVSIYGATAETYEKVSQVRGSYKRFIRGVENLRTTGLPWKMKTVLIKENAHEMADMQRMADEWGVEFRFDGNINPSIGQGKTAGKAPCASRVEEDKLVEAELSVEGHAQEATNLIEESEAPGKGERLYSCGAGNNSFYVNANGSLQMCLLTPHHGKSLKAGESVSAAFDQAWDAFAEVRQARRREDSPCRTCDLAALCENCPGFAQLETGDEHGVVDWLCRSTHMKAVSLGIKHSCSVKHYVYSPYQKGEPSDGKQERSRQASPVCEA